MGYVLYGGEGFTQSQFKTLYYTNNGGKTWGVKSYTGDFMATPQVKPIGSLSVVGYGGGIQFFEHGVGFMAFRAFGLTRSFDWGIDFSTTKNYGGQVFRAGPDFINSQVGFAAIATFDAKANEIQCLYSTTDGGDEWTELVSFDYFKRLVK
jgi:hypothetical protein